MQVQINVGQETSSHELRSLAIFFNHLAAAGEVVSVGQPPVIEKVQVQVVQPETVTPTNEAPLPEAGSEKTRRARRTKAEMEAAQAAPAAQAEQGEQEPVAAPPATQVAEAIDTATGEITGVEEFETAPAAGAKTYTEAEVQKLASDVARAKGPQIVKDKIAELGATRIAALTADQLNSLGTYLESQK